MFLFPYYPAHSLWQEVNEHISFEPLQELEEQSRGRQPPLTQSQNTQKIKEILTFQLWNDQFAYNYLIIYVRALLNYTARVIHTMI
jgi:hypothetical protein